MAIENKQINHENAAYMYENIIWQGVGKFKAKK